MLISSKVTSLPLAAARKFNRGEIADVIGDRSRRRGRHAVFRARRGTTWIQRRDEIAPFRDQNRLVEVLDADKRSHLRCHMRWSEIHVFAASQPEMTRGPPIRRVVIEASSTNERLQAHKGAGDGPALPPGWGAIAVGSLVLATTEGVADGWFEYQVIAVTTDGMLELEWRDFPEEPRILRSREQVALMHSKSMQT